MAAPTLLPDLATLRALVVQVLADKEEQGHEVAGLSAELAGCPSSYDALLAFAERLATLPLRADWPFVEPDETVEAVLAEAPGTERLPVRADVADRVETAFLARVCGCVLGKPFEFDPTLAELRAVLEPAGEWPLRDYVTEATNGLLRQPQPQWPELVRERIAHVAPDDDTNYTVLGMLLLEQHGEALTQDDVRRLWTYQLPVGATFGPERLQLVAIAAASLRPLAGLGAPEGRWAHVLNPTDEHCGALIRADAYGYASPGDPERAARLAYVDASTTHRRTGVYSTMWVAAAIAAALSLDPGPVGSLERLRCFELALGVVPARSRFAAVVRESLDLVAASTDWVDGYERLHGRFGDYTHCRVYQEVGTLMSTLRWAEDVGHGIGIQVCQGNDTDSFGATAGSLLGALMGPASFDREHWCGRFHDDVHLALATFYERSLSELARRMGRLAQR